MIAMRDDGKCAGFARIAAIMLIASAIDSAIQHTLCKHSRYQLLYISRAQAATSLPISHFDKTPCRPVQIEACSRHGCKNQLNDISCCFPTNSIAFFDTFVALRCL